MIVFTNARPINIRAEFDYLKLKGHKINGYVIMPNHLHVLIEFINAEKKINTIVSNGKRFLAYEIVDRLKNQKNTKTPLQLAQAVSPSDSKLVLNPIDYIHSSAKYYLSGEQGIYLIDE